MLGTARSLDSACKIVALVAVLNLTTRDAAVKGFPGSFTDGAYGCVVQSGNAAWQGRVARFSLQHVSTFTVRYLTIMNAASKGDIGEFMFCAAPQNNSAWHGMSLNSTCKILAPLLCGIRRGGMPH